MAIKTFTTGELLTASDTNTYLANSGLVYVTEAVFVNAAATTIDGCFSSSAAAYRIVYTQTNCTANADLRFYYRTSGSDIITSYFWNLWYTTSTGLSGIENSHSGAYGQISTIGSGSPDHIAILELENSPRHNMIIQSQGFQSGSRRARQGGCMNDDTSTVTGIKIFPASGTITGKITIYEYRIA